MKFKVDLSYIIDLSYLIDLVESVEFYPVDKIETNMIEWDELWDLLSGGYPVSHRNCVVRIVEEHSDD